MLGARRAACRNVFHIPVSRRCSSQPSSGASVVLIDWGRPVYTAPTVDLGYHLGWTAVERPIDVDEAIASYEARLRHRLGALMEGTWWETQRDIGILRRAQHDLLPRFGGSA